MLELVKSVTLYISQAAEMIAALIIGLSVVRTLYYYLASLFKSRSGFETGEEMRLQFGSSVAVALELLLGADVLATAVAPSWNDIGQLAAIAAIRTLLNYFLEKELRRVATGS